MYGEIKGLILAAGKGRRLQPLTKTIPKALIPLAGRPLINYPLLKLKKAGIRDIGIVIHPKDYSKFKSTLNVTGLKIKYIFQKIPRGTLKATELARNFLGNKRFLLCWCDFLSLFDFKQLIREHLKSRPAATILINKEKDPSGTAQVKFRGPYITKIVEKPKMKFSSWGLAGLLVLQPQVFEVFPKIRPSAKGEYHIPDVLQYLIDKGKKVRYVKIDTWRINVNNFEDLRKARTKIKSQIKALRT